MRPSRTIRTLTKSLAAVTVMLASVGIGTAQTLMIESKSISNGDVNVPTELDISIMFSKELAITGLPDVELGDLGLDLELFDEACASPPVVLAITPQGCPESWELQDGGKTLVLKNVRLAEDAIHTMLILFAVSTDGDVLARPDVTRFSTGAEVPQGSVSGKVSSDDVGVGGSVVALVPADVLDLVLGEDSTAIDPPIGFADEDGDYVVAFVPDGAYFAIGAQFDLASIAGQFAAVAKVELEGVGVGVHDPDANGVADPITISSGSGVTGVDVALHSQGATHNSAAAPVEAIVKGEVASARLSLGAGAPVEPNGTALLWTWLFTDFISGQGWLSATFGQVAFPPSPLMGEDVDLILALLGTATFTDNADSDQATQWFMQNGGEAFLAANPEAIGLALLLDRPLFDLILEVIRSGDIGIIPGFEIWSNVLGTEFLTDRLGAVLSKQTGEVWLVAFVGANAELPLHVVAMGDDGTPLLVIGSSPAASNQANANDAASAWASDAILVSVGALDVPVASDGTAAAWAYNYYSPAADSVLNVLVSGGDLGGVLTTTVLAADSQPTTDELIPNWIDSPEAVAAANEVAAGFIASHAGVVTTAVLSKGLQPGHPERAIWRITYIGTSPDGTTDIRVVDINAEDGVYVSAEEEASVPASFRLEQNYPNPFNPQTIIQYEIGERSHVTLLVFNPLGQEVRRLVDSSQAAGTYFATWNGRDASGSLLPSGVYLYRLETRGSTQTRRMILVK